MNGGVKKKHSRRRGEREALAHRLKSGGEGLARSGVSAEEALELLRSVDGDQRSRFGLVRLSRLRLDALLVFSDAPGHRMAAGTLLAYAALRQGRAAVVASLLRAGADPTVTRWRPQEGTLLGMRVRRRLQGLPPAFSAWVVVRFCHATFSTPPALISSCFKGLWDPTEEEPERERENSVLVGGENVEGCGLCPQKDSCGLLKLAPCGDVLCQDCFWTRALLDAAPDEELRCPVCRAILCAEREESPHQDPDEDWRQFVAASPPSQVADRSRDLFLLLPALLPPPLLEFRGPLLGKGQKQQPHHRHHQESEQLEQEQPSGKDIARTLAITDPLNCDEKRVLRLRKPRLEALPLHLTAALFAGTFQAARSTELLKAAVNGGLLRLRALVAAGVELDHRNEYGQTALMLAVIHQHLPAVRLLLRCGASPSISDNAFLSPVALAASLPCRDIFFSIPDALSSPSDLPPLLRALVDSSPLSDEFQLLAGRVTPLIDPLSSHPGAGSVALDGFLPESFLQRLEEVFTTLPEAPDDRDSGSCNRRRYFHDTLGCVQRVLVEVLRTASVCSRAGQLLAPMPHMRFLYYDRVGASLAPHTDLSRTDALGRTSTHTFILYLSDCSRGGETALLSSLSGRSVQPLAVVQPLRGRLLCFPHVCPHEGRPVAVVPKLLLRGELLSVPHPHPHQSSSGQV
ncbi:MAG: 2OG-Fe(II) oxygenase [archaeon]|nr:2OG-Fe(II) oxygenase [archaeon]